MIMSVIIAVIAWALVIYITDPDITKTFSGISVEIVGEETLAEKGLVIVERDRIPKTSMKMQGKRSDLMKALDKAKVVIDVSQIDAQGEAQLEPASKVPNSRIVVEKIGAQTIPVTVEKLTSKDVPIRIIQTGELSGSLVKSKATPDAATIEGAASELEYVEAVEVIVDISTITETHTDKYSYSLILADGVDRDELYTINMEENLIEITNTLYTEKELPVKIKVVSASQTLSEKDTRLDPKTVKVGIADGAAIDSLTVVIDEAAEEGEYKIEKEEGVYIPDSRRTVYIKPVWEKNE